MTNFVIYHTPHTGAGYFLTGSESEGFGGTYRLTEASKFKTKALALRVAKNYGAIGTVCTVLKETGDSN
jgi:hypothetical protein